MKSHYRITFLFFLCIFCIFSRVDGINLRETKVAKWFHQRKPIKPAPIPLEKQIIEPSPPPQSLGSELFSTTSTNDPSSLMMINILMFLFYGTLGAVMPYLPIFYRQQGVSDTQIGILGAITPAITFLVSPLWGFLADSTGWHKEIMLLTFIGSTLLRSLLIYVNNNMLLSSSIVALTAILNAPVRPLLDSAVMSMLTDKSAYGRSRLYGQIGMGIGSYLTGPFLTKNISILFWIQNILAIPTCLLMIKFRPKKEQLIQSTNKNQKEIKILATLQHTFRDPKVLIFFFVVFIIGISSGIIENFAYVRLTEIKGNHGDAFGLMRLLSSLAGGPMFYLSGRAMDYLGVNGVLTLSLIAYIVRFVIYAFVTNPWYAMPAELLRGFTFALFWSGATYYVYAISPPQLVATMLALLNGMFAGLGQSIGAIIGGELSRRYGIVPAFLYSAGVDALVTLAFMLYQGILYLQQQQSPTAANINNNNNNETQLHANKKTHTK